MSASGAAPRTSSLEFSRSMRVRLRVKRVIDIVAASVLLVVLSPAIAVIAVVIRVRDGRPVIFRQTRVGRGGSNFTMLKFRTMRPDAEEQVDELRELNERSGPLFKLNEDPRITRTGRFLRRSSLDELPQLLNVLGGSMSLVGPRPALPVEVDLFPDHLRQRELLPQGITGLWQLSGRTDPDFGKYTALDLAYIERWSLRLDLSILLRTPFVVLSHSLRRQAVATVDEVPVPSSAPGPSTRLPSDPVT